MSGRAILALDTSCYTTSCALVGAAGEAIVDLRLPLPVPPGQRGLRQAEAVFAHLIRLPGLVGQAMDVARTRGWEVVGVAASTRPRPPRDSYLPVFRVGEGFGRALAASLGVPFGDASHQEGHLAAGWHAGLPDTLLAVHVSGGTTELLRLQGGCPWEVVSLGTSLDLHAGQFLDRVGVALGLPFPAGPALDRLAGGQAEDAVTAGAPPGADPRDADGETGAQQVAIPVTVRGYRPSFAGPEAAAMRLIERGTAPPLVARAALLCVARALEKMVLAAIQAGEPRVVLVVGGVAASSLVRERLRHRLAHPAVGMELHFPPPELCTDNAVGVGRWAWQRAQAPVHGDDLKGLGGASVE
ncbi:MAG: O-sialoglycoprotein endopeptidase [Bacillota bacterium]